MNIDEYTIEMLQQELADAREDKAHYETCDKRLKSVKYQLFWANTIIKRDTAELKRRAAL